MSVVPLGELVNIQTGKLDANASSDDGAYPFFTCAREPLKISDWKYDLDAILVAGNGDLNVKHYSGKFDAYQRTYILDVEDKNRLDTRYLYHFMDTYLDTLREQSIGGIIKYIKLGMLKEAPIPLPTLHEQKRIAAILDQADALRRLRRRAIDRLNTLGQSIFYEMFGDPKLNPKDWELSPLGEIAKFYSGNSLPAGEQFDGQEEGYLLCKVSDMNLPQNSRSIEIASSWSSEPGARAGTCPPNSLIFPKRGGAIGTNKKRILARPAILDPNLMGVSPDTNIISTEYLFGWFNTFNLSDIASGSSVPQLNKQDIAPLKIMIPPHQLQSEYGTRVLQILTQKKDFTQAEELAIALFGTLQQRAFQGDL